MGRSQARDRPVGRRWRSSPPAGRAAWSPYLQKLGATAVFTTLVHRFVAVISAPPWPARWPFSANKPPAQAGRWRILRA